MATTTQALAIGVRHHLAGRLQAAEQIYRQILAVQPDQPDALHLLGVIAHQVGQNEVAIEHIQRAIAGRGNDSAFHNNLGEAYRALRKFPEAITCYRRALELKPHYVEAQLNLGSAWKGLGRLDEALACCQRALGLQPGCAEAHNNLGIVLYDLRRCDEALACYRRALELKPQYPDAHYNAGLALQEQGQLDAAAACFLRAIQIFPAYADAHYNLGLVLQRQGKVQAALAAYRRALELRPNYAEAHNNIGLAILSGGNLVEAVACYRRALQCRPDYAEAYNNLGHALHGLGQLDEALACFRRLLDLQPDLPAAHNNLGNALKDVGDLPQALACYRRALELKPDYAEAYNNLGIVFHEQGNLAEAVACCRRALQCNPQDALAHNSLGAALHSQGQLDEAIASYRRALALNPALAAAHANLASAFRDQGNLGEALAGYRRALELHPGLVAAHSNLVYTLNFASDREHRTLHRELRNWSRRHAAPLAAQILPYANDRTPGRRLRVGYVSPDLRWHPVGRFLLPLLQAHDRTQFEIFCYAAHRAADEITHRCRAAADAWRDVRGLSDAQLAQLVRQDGVDVLVDLSMHMGQNRLLTFARKPAPVQVTYLAYCGTTGLETIDYRLTDAYLDPPDREPTHYAEQSVHLADSCWCYQPPDEAPPVADLPALAARHVTFGCLNDFCKLSVPTLAAWCRLLIEVPDARLLLHAHPGSHRERVLKRLRRQGIRVNRVEFVPRLPIADYLRLHDRIDVALDPFPYGGDTTTCDALWMGVPVVSLAGRRAVGRGGVSILSNLGLQELLAADVDHYVRIAAALAADRPRLQHLRATLRQRMQDSPLTDAPRFARQVEAAYHRMWQRWCVQ